MKNIFKNVLNIFELSGFLLIILPLCTFIFVNYCYLLPLEIFLSTIIIFIIYLCLMLISKLAKKHYNIILITLSFLLALSYQYYFSKFFIDNIFKFYLYAFIIFVIILFFVIKNKAKFLNVFLIFCLIASSFWYFVILQNDIFQNKKLIEKFNSNEEFENVKFKHKSNIYYFYLESYSGNIALKYLFDYDNSDFLKELASRNFYTWKNSYSNYDNTAMSLYSTFTMAHHYYYLDVGHSIFGQNVVMGNKYNTLLKVLNKNGYDINYYFYPIHFAKPFNSYANFKNLWFISLIRVKNLILMQENDLASPNFPYEMSKYAEIFRKDLDRNLKSTKPQFYFVKFSKIRHYVQYFDFKPNFKQNYISNLRDTNIEIIKMIDYIEKNDPNSIIILLGDHGSWIYKFSDSVVIPSNYALSQYNILLSIKNPYERFENRPEVLSSVNVFRYVISSLTENFEFMKNKKSDVSFALNDCIYVENGRVLKDVIKFLVVD